jgi:cysteinyl-tRNA synthetase
MAKKYLGPTFDIHGGGVDNIFPHNECEIMQSEAANGADFAKYWMLVGSLMVPDTIDGTPVKMSKSLGNFVTIRDALEQNPPEVVRTLILTSHYRNTLTYSDESFSGARAGWDRIMGAVTLTREKLRNAPAGDDGNGFQSVLDATREKFITAMDDDFNAPGALATLYDLTREVNALLNSDATVGINVLNAINDTYRELGGDVLGIIPENVLSGANAGREESLIRLLVELRTIARENKDFDISDRIRDEMAAAGILLEDGADGTIWRIN